MLQLTPGILKILKPPWVSLIFISRIIYGFLILWMGLSLLNIDMSEFFIQTHCPIQRLTTKIRLLQKHISLFALQFKVFFTLLIVSAVHGLSPKKDWSIITQCLEMSWSLETSDWQNQMCLAEPPYKSFKWHRKR